MDFLQQTLHDLKDAGLLRELRQIEGAQGPTVHVAGREYLCLCSNNYLSLAARPEVRQAVRDAVDEFGWGSGASRLISGNMTLHDELERAIARFKRKEAAIVFPTGYMTNVGAISSLVSSGDAVIVDRLNHASIIDGCRLAGAKMLVYHHCDAERLEQVLKRAGKYRRKLVITDSVFSMDGDVAPLPQIIEVCRRHDAMLMIDEAHATGVLGKTGRGSEEHFGLPQSSQDMPIVMGTLSKAIGSLGGFVAGSSDLIAYLRNKARSFIYTTALPPAVCAASLAAIRLIENEPDIVGRLHANIRLMNELVSDGQSRKPAPTAEKEGQAQRPAPTDHVTPIFPIHIGDADAAVRLAGRLMEAGFLCPAIRPPTVPDGTSRLRLSIQADHSREQLRRFAAVLQNFAKNP